MDAGIKPDGIIPFRNTEEYAEKIFYKKMKWHTYDAIKNSDIIFKGVYIPYWIFDCDLIADYEGESGKYYFENEEKRVKKGGEWIVKTESIKKVKWSAMAGNHGIYFKNTLSGCSTLNNSEKLPNYNLRKIVEYKSEFTAGFYIEKSQKSSTDAFKQVKSDLQNKLKEAIEDRFNYDEVRKLTYKYKYKSANYKSVLFPMWISSIKYKDKIYRFIIDGQSGKFYGKFPLDMKKTVFPFLGLLILIMLMLTVKYLIISK